MGEYLKRKVESLGSLIAQVANVSDVDLEELRDVLRQNSKEAVNEEVRHALLQLVEDLAEQPASSNLCRTIGMILYLAAEKERAQRIHEAA